MNPEEYTGTKECKSCGHSCHRHKDCPDCVNDVCGTCTCEDCKK